MEAEAKREELNMVIRPLCPEDAAAVTEILREAPEAANWSGQSVAELVSWAGGLALVIEFGGEIRGFLLGRQVADEAEILNIGVKAANRRQGKGGALLKSAMEEFRVRGASRVFLEVRESNEAAIAFYAGQGFSRRGRRGGYYRDPEEAAVVMEAKLGD